MTTLKKVFIVVYYPRGCPSYDTRILATFAQRKDAESHIKKLVDEDEGYITDVYIIDQSVIYPKQKKSATR